jgi:molybdenum cofactor cytidylyltransferase
VRKKGIVEYRAVVLAAGESKRMGEQKLLLPFHGRPMIEHTLEVASRWKPLVVAGREVAEYLAQREGVAVVRNDHPERGMTYSLALANEAIERDAALIVLLGDKPLVSPQIVETLCDASADADVAFPREPQTGEPGHPVIFSPRARAKISSLPDGDSLRALRDDPSLERREIPVADLGAYFDIDTAGSLEE